MNKQKILKEIHKAEEHLANMKKALKECKYGKWKPEIDETYFYLTGNLKPFSIKNYGVTSNIEALESFNCFQTEEEAEKEATKILIRRKLEDIASRLNKDNEIDWNNSTQLKYCIYFDFVSNEIISCQTSRKKGQGTIYCLNKSFRNIAVEEIGKERLTKYLKEGQ